MMTLADGGGGVSQKVSSSVMVIEGGGAVRCLYYHDFLGQVLCRHL